MLKRLPKNGVFATRRHAAARRHYAAPYVVLVSRMPIASWRRNVLSRQPVKTGEIPRITIDEAALQAGLGPMLADLLRQNLEQYPERQADLARMQGTVTIEARDAAVAVTMDFDRVGLYVKGAAPGRSDIRIATDSLGLLELTAARLRAGLPDIAHSSGRRVLRQLLSGRLKISGPGLILKPALLLRLNRLLNVASSVKS